MLGRSFLLALAALATLSATAVKASNPDWRAAVGDADPEDWSFCSRENENCAPPNSGFVRYGDSVNGRWSVWMHKIGAGETVNCDNSRFGDPSVGHTKVCMFIDKTKLPRWHTCAQEGQNCYCPTGMTRMGKDGRWNYRGRESSAPGHVRCENNEFWSDAYPGVKKECQCARFGAGLDIPEGYHIDFAGFDGQTAECDLYLRQAVVYGTEGLIDYVLNRDYKHDKGKGTSFECNAQALGVGFDIAPGQRKMCWCLRTAAQWPW